MSGPKALQLLRDAGGGIRCADWTRGHYWVLAPWGGNGGEEALLHLRPTRDAIGEAVGLAIVRGEDLRATNWLHEEGLTVHPEALSLHAPGSGGSDVAADDLLAGAEEG